MTNTNLYMIRHGEGAYQVASIVAGMKADTGLSPLGVKQAERLRDRLAGTGEIKADVLIASTLGRAYQTAQIIAPALGLPLIPDDELHELRPGEADGLTFEASDQKYGKPDFHNYPLRPVSPGGENWGQFMLRVGTALDRITRQYQGQTIVLVAHGGIIDGAFLYFFGLNTLKLPPVELYTHNTSVTHWQLPDRQALPPRWRLMKYNDDLHLRDLPPGKVVAWDTLAGSPVVGHDQPAVPLPTEQNRSEQA